MRSLLQGPVYAGQTFAGIGRPEESVFGAALLVALIAMFVAALVVPACSRARLRPTQGWRAQT